MPGHVGQLIPVSAPVMRHARDAPAGIIGLRSGVEDLTDDRVFGPYGGGDGFDRGADRGMATMAADWLQRGRRFRQRQLRSFGEKLRDRIELPVIDTGSVPVYQVAESSPLRCAEHHVGSERRCAQADNSSLAWSRSVIGGIASTRRSAP